MCANTGKYFFCRFCESIVDVVIELPQFYALLGY